MKHLQLYENFQDDLDQVITHENDLRQEVEDLEAKLGELGKQQEEHMKQWTGLLIRYLQHYGEPVTHPEFAGKKVGLNYKFAYADQPAETMTLLNITYGDRLDKKGKKFDWEKTPLLYYDTGEKNNRLNPIGAFQLYSDVYMLSIAMDAVNAKDPGFLDASEMGFFAHENK